MVGVGGQCGLVACGSVVSYAVTKEGQCYSWGMGTNGQLGTGEDDDVWTPTLMKYVTLSLISIFTVQ